MNECIFIKLTGRKTNHGSPYAIFKCGFCGNEFETVTHSVKNGNTKSCGCLNRRLKYNINVGDKFGKLEIIEILPKHRVLVRCNCEDKVEKIIYKYSLINNDTKSCGCIKSVVDCNSKSRIYQTFRHMINRCYDTKNKSYKDYGARKILVCNEWNPNVVGITNAFLNFKNWAKNNGYTDELTIERINNNGNYEPNNCKWIPQSEQAKNKRNVKLYSLFNEIKTLIDWTKDYRCKCNYDNLRYRMRKNWNFEEALLTPTLTPSLAAKR